MKHIQKIGLFASAVVLGLVFMANTASAQFRIGVQLGRGYYRPPIVRPYYAPYGYSGYYNPYRQYHSDRYYDRQSLNYARNRLRNDEDKYYGDGYLTDKEQRKLDSDRYKIARDRNRLHDDW